MTNTSDIENLFNEAGEGEYYASATAVRPDGRYALAIMGWEDPDFPTLWLADLENGAVKQLEPEEGHDLIDWPGSHLKWPANDFQPVAFDYLNGFTRFDVSMDNLTFRWLGPIERTHADIASDEWWVSASLEEQLDWKRFRVYHDNSAQLFYQGPQGPRYDYFYDADKARQEMQWRHIPVFTDASGIASAGKAELKDAARQLNEVLSTLDLRPPEGECDKELSMRLKQPISPG